MKSKQIMYIHTYVHYIVLKKYIHLRHNKAEYSTVVAQLNEKVESARVCNINY